MLIVAIIVAVVLLATLAVWALVYLGTGSLKVNTTTPFVAAGDSTTFSAVITMPPLVTAGAVAWQFGDGTNASVSGTSADHTYDFGGTFFVGATSTLSNGKSVDNFDGLFPMQVGPRRPTSPNPLGATFALGLIALNKTASSAGAPIIAVDGTIVVQGGVQQAPDFFWATETNPANNTWQNFSWQVTQLTFDFGDGSSPTSTADLTAPYVVSHRYSKAGIYAITLDVKTQNYTTWQFDGLPAEPVPVPVLPAQTETTATGLSIGVGNYRLITYAGSIINPGVIVNMVSGTGGSFTLDPSINYVGSEPISNMYETLLAFDGIRTDSFVPVIADSLPTHSSDFMSYTFHIRQGLTFTDGTPVTPYDVKYSYTRTLLFVDGSPPTSGWIFAQYLVPTNEDGTWNLSFDAVNNAITTDDAAQTVTFHLVTPAPPILWHQIVTGSLGGSIVSHTWLESVGPKLVWSDAGFADYQQYGFLPNYVSAWRNGAVGSGPYMLDYLANPNAIVMKRNPTFVAVSGVPAPTVDKVVIEYVADDSTRELSLESGRADIAGIATSRFDSALRMQGQGLINILFVPTLTLYWWNFNMEIAGSSVGPNNNPYGNHVPSDFFVDINMRKAFFYAFNFDRYINQILGNEKFHAKFGELYNGIIPKGMLGYQNLSSMDVYDMDLAHYYYNQTEWVQRHRWDRSGFTLALNVGDYDPVAKAAAAMWAQDLQTLAPGITINVVPIVGSEVTVNAVPHENPMAIYSVGFGWAPDYPFPPDYTVPMYLPGTAANEYGGYYTATNGFNISYFDSISAGRNQVENMTKMLNWIEDSIYANATNIDMVVWDSQQANMMGANMTLYVPEFQLQNFVTYRTWISGMDKETNPMNGGMFLLYYFLSKATSTSSSSVQSHALDGLSLLSSAFAIPLAAIVPAGRCSRPRDGSEDRE